MAWLASVVRKGLRGDYSSFNLFVFVLRTVLYVLSCVAYIVAQNFDEREQRRTGIVFPFFEVRMEDWMKFALVAFSYTALADSVILVGVKRDIISYKDLINLGVAICASLRLGGRSVVIPTFLHVWNAGNEALRAISLIMEFNSNWSIELKRLYGKVFKLGWTIASILLTSLCAVELAERETTEYTLFNSLWFVIVTFSTVGYGDISPESVIGRVIVMVMIVVSLALLPAQISSISEVSKDLRTLGRNYKSHALYRKKRHVVCIMGRISATTLQDFLEEMMIQRIGYRAHVVVLSPFPITHDVKSLILDERFKENARFLQGSALNDRDLKRAKVREAQAVFIIADRTGDPREKDRESIMRSWAVNDFARYTRLFVQVRLLESVQHVSFATVMCMEEIRFSLLAVASFNPGVSTLLSNLAYGFTAASVSRESSSFDVNAMSPLRLYERYVQREMLEVVLETNSLFRPHAGKPYVTAASELLRHEITLIGVVRGKRIFVNPSEKRRTRTSAGTIVYAEFILQSSDICIFIGSPRVLEDYTDETASHASAARDSSDGRMNLSSTMTDASPHGSNNTSLAQLNTRSLMSTTTPRTSKGSDDDDDDDGSENAANKDGPAHRNLAAVQGVDHDAIWDEDDHITAMLQQLTHGMASKARYSKEENQAYMEYLESIRRVHKRVQPEFHRPDLQPLTVQARLKRNSLFPGSGSVKCHWLEYADEKGRITKITRDSKELLLSWDIIELHSPTLPSNAVRRGSLSGLGLFRAPSISMTAVASSKEAGHMHDDADDHAPPNGDPSSAALPAMRAPRGSEVHAPKSFIILGIPSGEVATSALLHYFRVLRSAAIPPEKLQPVVVVVDNVETQLTPTVLKFMRQSPLLYYHEGSLDNPDCLLQTCLKVSRVVLVLSHAVETEAEGEDAIADGLGVVTAQIMQKLSPDQQLIVELEHRPNVRFINFVGFSPSDEVKPTTIKPSRSMTNLMLRGRSTAKKHAFSAKQTKLLAWRKRFHKYDDTGASFLFRPAYASGQVFSSNLLGALLYQGLRREKSHSLRVFRQLLGCDGSNITIENLTLTKAYFGAYDSVLQASPLRRRSSRGKRSLRTYGGMFTYLLKENQTIAIGVKVKRQSKASEDLLATSQVLHQAHNAEHSLTTLVLLSPHPDFILQEGDVLYTVTRRRPWSKSTATQKVAAQLYSNSWRKRLSPLRDTLAKLKAVADAEQDRQAYAEEGTRDDKPSTVVSENALSTVPEERVAEGTETHEHLYGGPVEGEEETEHLDALADRTISFGLNDAAHADDGTSDAATTTATPSQGLAETVIDDPSPYVVSV